MTAPFAAVSALAKAVSVDGRAKLLVDVNGRKAFNGQWTDVDSAVASGSAFMVDLRDGLIAIDVDQCEGDSTPDTAVDTVKKLGASVVRVASGRADNEHVFILAPVGWGTDDLVTLVEGIGVPKSKVRRGGASVRPPLSPHPAGGHGRLLEPATWQEAWRQLSSRPGRVPLDPKWRIVLSGGDTADNKYGGARHKAIAAYATACVNADSRFEEFAASVRASIPLNAKLSAIRDPDAWLAKTWESARQWVRKNPPTSQAVDLAPLRRTARAHSWSGRGGDTDCRVYTFLVEQCAAINSDVVGCDQRRLALQVGVERKTVARSLKRLASTHGLITLMQPGDRRAASVYRLHAEPAANDSNKYLSPPSKEVTIGVTNNNFGTRMPDVFRGRAGLPRAAWSTFQALPSDGSAVTVRQIAAARVGGVTAATVRQHLRQMLSVGLVDRNGPAGQRWWRRPEADLDAAATSLGASGATARQEQRHADERLARDRGIQPSGVRSAA